MGEENTKTMKPLLPKRGTAANPENRFERIRVDADEAADDDDSIAPATEFYNDASRSILAANDSPDIPFRFSLNPYRGCEHGCIYCYARPSHEYLGFSAGLDFERKILVKRDAAQLLRRALLAPRWQPQVVALSGNTDCYQPIERRLGITRRCLEVFAEFRNPVGIITKNATIIRDIDILRRLSADGCVHVHISITSLDPEVARRMEPRASRPSRRLDAIGELTRAGVPVAVSVAPIIPGLNDEEIPAILGAAANAGASAAHWTLLRLPQPVDALFEDWVAQQFPHRRERITNRIRECRDGELTDGRFGRRMRGQGVYAQQISQLFRASARRLGLAEFLPTLNPAAFRRPPQSGEQLSLC